MTSNYTCFFFYIFVRVSEVDCFNMINRLSITTNLPLRETSSRAYFRTHVVTQNVCGRPTQRIRPYSVLRISMRIARLYNVHNNITFVFLSRILLRRRSVTRTAGTNCRPTHKLRNISQSGGRLMTREYHASRFVFQMTGGSRLRSL